MIRVFEGTFEECLEKVRQGARDDLQKLADFTGVASRTAAIWIYEPTHGPLGDTWIRCVEFFRLQEWSIVDFDDSDPLRVAIVESIALGVVTHAELLEEAGYVVRSNNSPLHPFVYGDRQLMRSSRKLLENFFAAREEAIRVAREEATILYQVEPIVSEISISTEDVAPLIDRLRVLLQEGEDDVRRAAILLRIAAPLIRAICEDKSSDGDIARQQLRDLVGQETYSILSVDLNVMRSRTTYERAKKGAVN